MKRRRVFFAFALLFVLAACSGRTPYVGTLVKQYGGEKTRPDAVAQRRIVLVHPPSGETLSLTYYKNGNYDPVALRKVDRLFRDRRRGESIRIDPELVDFLVDIRSRLGLSQDIVFEILSGYRAPETNNEIRRQEGQAAKNSLHILGYAVDFRIRNVNGRAVAEIAKTMQRGGVSYYPASNHVHIDIGNIRSWAAR